MTDHDGHQHQRKGDFQVFDEAERTPARSAMPATVRLARGADQRAVAAETGAERQRPPQRHQALPVRRRSGAIALISGIIVATNGMLSTIADSTAEAHRIASAGDV